MLESPLLSNRSNTLLPIRMAFGKCAQTQSSITLSDVNSFVHLYYDFSSSVALEISLCSQVAVTWINKATSNLVVHRGIERYFMLFNISPNSKIIQNPSITITFPLELSLSRVARTAKLSLCAIP